MTVYISIHLSIQMYKCLSPALPARKKVEGVLGNDALSRRHGIRSSDNISNPNDGAMKGSKENSVDGMPDTIAEDSTTTLDMTSEEAAPGFPVIIAQNYGTRHDSSLVANQVASTSRADFLDPTNVFPTTAWSHHTVLIWEICAASASWRYGSHKVH